MIGGTRQGKLATDVVKQVLVTAGAHPHFLPEGWAWIIVAGLGEIVTGSTPSKKQPTYYGNKCPLFKPKDLNQSYFVKTAGDMLSADGAEKARLIPERAIMVTCIGATIGKVGFSRLSCATNQQINTIIPQHHAYPEYVYFVSISPFFQQILKQRSSSTTLPILNKSKFSKLPFPLPPLAEQKRIVKKLDSMLGKIKEARELIREAKESFEQRRAAILHKAFTGGFTKPWRKSQLRRSQKNPDISIPFVEKLAMDLPEGWKWVNFSKKLTKEEITNENYAIRIIDGDRGKNYPKKAEFKENGFCVFLNTGNVLKTGFSLEKCDFISKERDLVLSKGKLKRWDIALTTRGTLGNVGLYHEDVAFEHLRINSGMVIVRVNPGVVVSRYIFLWLQSPQFRKKVAQFQSGSAQPQLPIKSMSEILFPLPPLEEQREIVQVLEQTLKPEEEAKELLEMEDQLDLLEKSILSKAFRGELGTGDPNDEPAVELLKRVMAEKEDPKRTKKAKTS